MCTLRTVKVLKLIHHGNCRRFDIGLMRRLIESRSVANGDKRAYFCRDARQRMKIHAPRLFSIFAASLLPLVALCGEPFQAPAQIVEYKEVVPLSSGQVRAGDVCVNFSPVMTSGSFFDGLQRRETPSGDEFRINSRVVKNFPEQITVQMQLSISVCDADIYTPAPAPGFVNGIRFKAQWKRELAMRPVAQFAVQRVAITSEEGDSRMLFLLKIRDQDVPLTDHLIISVMSPQGKLMSRMSGRL